MYIVYLTSKMLIYYKPFKREVVIIVDYMVCVTTCPLGSFHNSFRWMITSSNEPDINNSGNIFFYKQWYLTKRMFSNTLECFEETTHNLTTLSSTQTSAELSLMCTFIITQTLSLLSVSFHLQLDLVSNEKIITIQTQLMTSTSKTSKTGKIAIKTKPHRVYFSDICFFQKDIFRNFLTVLTVYCSMLYYSWHTVNKYNENLKKNTDV